jgi:hypothetical protein
MINKDKKVKHHTKDQVTRNMKALISAYMIATTEISMVRTSKVVSKELKDVSRSPKVIMLLRER